MVDKQTPLSYWEKRAVEQDAKLHHDIKAPEQTILKAYIHAQEYLKSETKKIFDRYLKDGMTAEELTAALNVTASQSDLNELIRLAKTTENKIVKEQLQNFLSTMAAKARITRLEMLQAKAAIVVKQLTDIQLQQENSFYIKTIEEAYNQAAAEAIIAKADHDVKLIAPDALPQIDNRQAAIAFVDPETEKVVKAVKLNSDEPISKFKKISTSQTRKVLDLKWYGGNYSSRIWKNTDQLADTLQELFTTQQMSGMSERDMALKLEKQFHVGAYVARRLIRTEANFVAGQAKLMGWREHGIKQYVLIAVLDFRTSEICREKDGKVFNVADAKCDGASGNYPPFHSFCRTVAAAYFGKDTFVGKHKVNNPLGHSFEMPAGSTYQEWENKLIEKYGKNEVEKQQIRVDNYSDDMKQFAKYRSVIPEDMPQNIEQFQEMKYNGGRDYNLIKLDYRRRIRLKNDPSLALPNAEDATADSRKFTGYLFNSDNSEGFAKGRAFDSALGYNKENFQDLQSALLKGATNFPTRIKSIDKYGKHIEQQMVIKGANGRLGNVVVGWTVNGEKTWLSTTFLDQPKKGM